MVAVDEGETVVGFAQMLGDGIVQCWLAQVGVLAAHGSTAPSILAPSRRTACCTSGPRTTR